VFAYSDCGAENTLKAGDVIQCRECGYRILYKKRTTRSTVTSIYSSSLINILIFLWRFNFVLADVCYFYVITGLVIPTALLTTTSYAAVQ
jgi:DNA-directed RNA polymerase I, II, and III subunit RPABC4